MSLFKEIVTATLIIAFAIAGQTVFINYIAELSVTGETNEVVKEYKKGPWLAPKNK